MITEADYKSALATEEAYIKQLKEEKIKASLPFLKGHITLFRKALKLSVKTGWKCKRCGNNIYKYMPIGGMFCYRCPIESLNFKMQVNYDTEHFDLKEYLELDKLFYIK